MIATSQHSVARVKEVSRKRSGYIASANSWPLTKATAEVQGPDLKPQSFKEPLAIGLTSRVAFLVKDHVLYQRRIFYREAFKVDLLLSSPSRHLTNPCADF